MSTHWNFKRRRRNDVGCNNSARVVNARDDTTAKIVPRHTVRYHFRKSWYSLRRHQKKRGLESTQNYPRNTLQTIRSCRSPWKVNERHSSESLRRRSSSRDTRSTRSSKLRERISSDSTIGYDKYLLGKGVKNMRVWCTNLPPNGTARLLTPSVS